MSADKYVSSLATGGGAGTLGDPYALWELRTASIINDDVIGVLDDGVYTPNMANVVGNVWCLVGAGNQNLTIMPLDEDGNYDPDARIRIDATGLTGVVAVLQLRGQFNQLIGAEIDGGGAGIVVSDGGNTVAHCKVTNAAGNGVSLNARDLKVINTLCEDCGSNGFSLGGFDAISLIDCAAIGNGAVGFSGTFGTRYAALTRCIAQDNTGRGFSVGTSCLISRCTARDNGGDGFHESANNNLYLDINAAGNGGYGVNLLSTGARSVVLRPFFGSGGDANTLGQSSVAGEVFGAASGDPAYAAADDSTPGASSDALGVGWPSVYKVNGSTGVDAGAIQAADATQSDASRAAMMGVF